MWTKFIDPRLWLLIIAQIAGFLVLNWCRCYKDVLFIAEYSFRPGKCAVISCSLCYNTLSYKSSKIRASLERMSFASKVESQSTVPRRLACFLVVIFCFQMRVYSDTDIAHSLFIILDKFYGRLKLCRHTQYLSFNFNTQSL